MPCGYTATGLWVGGGYEDLNGHGTLRNGIAFQAAPERGQALGRRPTLCRVGQQAGRGPCGDAMNIRRNRLPRHLGCRPESLTLDFDATGDPVHGQQEGRFFLGLLPALLFPAALCLLWRPVPGELFTPQQH